MNEDEKLFLAAINADDTLTCLELLSAKKVSPDFREDANALPILFLATARGNEDVVRQLLQMGANFYDFSVNVESPLYLASAYGYSSIVKLLLLEFRKRFADFPKSRVGDSVVDLVLFIASFAGHISVVRQALEYGANIDFLLHDDDLVNVVMKVCQSVTYNLGILAGKSSLMVAAARGYEVIVDLLLSTGADPNLVKKSNISHPEPVTQLQLFKNKDFDRVCARRVLTIIGGSALFYVYHGAEIDIIKQLLAYGADVNLTADGGLSPLTMAVLTGDFAKVKVLYEAGANEIPRTKSMAGITGVYSARSETTRCMEFLESPPQESVTKHDAALRERVKPDYFSPYEEIRRRGKLHLARLVGWRKMTDQQDIMAEEKSSLQTARLAQYREQVKLLQDTQRKMKEDFALKLEAVKEEPAKELLELPQKIAADFAPQLEAERQGAGRLREEQTALKAELSRQSAELKQESARAKKLAAERQEQIVEERQLRASVVDATSNIEKLKVQIAKLEEQLMALQKTQDSDGSGWHHQGGDLRKQCEKGEKEIRALVRKVGELERNLNLVRSVVEKAVTGSAGSLMMRNPVVAADGRSYEEEFITRYFATSHVSPVTGEKLGNLSLFPNVALRGLIDWVKKCKIGEGSSSEPEPVPVASSGLGATANDDGWTQVSSKRMHP